jgi:hypothetical protein
MLKISGMREVVVIMREILVNLFVFSTYGLLVTCLFFFTEYRNCVQPSLFFVFVEVFFVNLLMIDLLIDYALSKNKRTQFLIKIFYYGANFFVVLFQVFSVANAPSFGQMLAQAMLPIPAA